MKQFRQIGVVRFGEFEFDWEQGVLRKGGLPIRLQTQPFQILAALLEHPGAVVPREELRQRLWPEDTFVDFEHGLNAAVTRLRQALRDSASKPRYIETVAKRGYRFCAEIERYSDKGKEDSATPAAVPKRAIGVWIAALAAASAGALFLFWRPTEPAFGNPVPLTTLRGIETHPALSPDGNQVAFTWNGERQDNFDIYVMPVAGGTPTRLTTDPADDVSPAWSPDGRTIAFLRRLGDDSGGLMVVAVTGGLEHELRRVRDAELRGPPLRLISLAWSPDGLWIAASHRESEGSAEGIHLFSLNGESRRLTWPRGNLGDHMPAFSPDSSALAFCRLSGALASEIYLLRLQPNYDATGEVRRLTAHNRWSRNPVWTEDGRTILYATMEPGPTTGDLRAIDVRTPNAPSRIISPSRVSELSLGRHLVYSQWTNDSNIWRTTLVAPGVPLPQPELHIASTRGDDVPRYSPDGKKIAFRSNRSGSDEIWIANADGSSPVRLTFFNGGLVGYMSWSEDGHFIVFHARPEGQADVYTVAAAGGTPRRLTHEPSDDALASYSRDGRWIYFASNRSGQFDIWKMPANGGEAVQLTFSGGERPVESMDGKTIYYLSKREAKEILSIPVEGGQPIRVAGPTDLPTDIAVTDAGLYYTAPPHSGSLRFIRFLAFATGQTRPVALANHHFTLGVSVSPDGRHLIYGQADDFASDLMLVKDFRVP